MLWLASVLAAILTTVFISSAVIQRVQVDPQNVGATQVARLSADPGVQIPGSFGPDIQAFSEFYGLRVLLAPTGSGWMSGEYNDECVLVVTSAAFARATADSFDSQIFLGCAANAFPATVAMKVSSDMPAELRRRYPEGTALQFVFDERGSDVVVFSSAG